MGKSAAVLAGILFCALTASPADAQEKKAGKKAPERAQKILLDNERVRATEGVFKPGEANPMMPRPYRVTRVLRGDSQMVRTHADGRTEKLVWKSGDVFASGPDNSSTKNVGNTEVVIYTVTLKQAK